MVQADSGLSAGTATAMAIPAERDTRSTVSTLFAGHAAAGGKRPTRRKRREVLWVTTILDYAANWNPPLDISKKAARATSS